MDCAEEQQQELEALLAIYADDVQVECAEYPRVQLSVAVRTTDDDSSTGGHSAALACQLNVAWCAHYPEQPAELRLDGLDEHFDEARLDRVLADLADVATESLGCAMTFTLVSSLQEHLEQLLAELKQRAVEEAERKLRQEEEAERMKVHGVPVTVESFMAWKEAFDQEMARLAQRRPEVRAWRVLAAAAERARQTTGRQGERLTGKQQFLRDATLNMSDLALLDGPNAPLQIDESLFDDAAQLDSADDDDDDGP